MQRPPNDHRSGRMLSLNSYPNFMGPGQHPNIFAFTSEAADAEKRAEDRGVKEGQRSRGCN